jgi:serine/threonine protein kinase
MSLEIGQKLSSYEITSLIGKGGMGEVYRARDSKLKRDVAIKALPDEFSRDHDRLIRFQREAEVLASLNHPNIAAIYDLEEANNATFLVLELVEGETLAARIERGPIPVEEALNVARHICEALETAHEKGVVHRDLKPANVKVTREGKVKVLDFGLAKAFAQEAPSRDTNNSPTQSASPTIAGVILGTAAYMSPEQARGKIVDKRTDIWAFGCVLYELLTGKRAFYGEDTTETLAAVIKGEPDWASLPASTPPGIRVLLRRCLQKDVARRLRDATDIRIEIEEALAASTAVLQTAPAIAPPAAWRRMLPWAVAVVLSVVIGIAVWTLKPKPVPEQQPVSRAVIALPPSTALLGGNSDSVSLSPDGSHLAYVASGTGGIQQLYSRAMNALEASPLAGTEGAFSPFFSPDGQWIGFFSGGKLMKISVSGGAALTLCSVPDGRGASWGPNDTIVFSPSAGALGLQKVPSAGGEPQPFTALQQGETSHRWPQFLPGGKTVLFTIGTGLSYDDAAIAVQRLDSSERKVLLRGGANARYVPTGHLVYYRAGTMMAVPFDPERLELTGAPAPVVEAVLGDINSGAAQFTLSNRGSLAYVSGGAQSANVNLVWVDRHGIAQVLPAPLHEYRYPRLSPDGRQVVVGIGNDIWIYDLPRDTLTRFTFDGNISLANIAAFWTRDGKRVVFTSPKGGGADNLFWKPADGSGPEERLTTGPYQQRIGTFSPDGRAMIYTMADPKTGNDLWVMPLDGDRKPRVFLQTRFSESSGQISPDGRWVAYGSDESGRMEVYVRPFPGPGGKWQVSTDGGSEMVWSPKGNELFYRTGARREKMMAVDVQTQPIFTAGKPRLLFEGPYIAATGGGGAGAGATYSVSPDGQRFLMTKAPDQRQAALTQINVVLNWFEEQLSNR